MAHDAVVDAMRSDWDERACDDANYYVAFGRRNQPEQEFFDSAADQVRLFETELKRRSWEDWRGATALEIGCGPGRLLRPLSRHFREIHGVDISKTMLQRANKNLEGVHNYKLHHAVNSDLAQFADASIDFIYSYAVFQHIPSKQIVFRYLSDAIRILTPGGLLVFQINGLPESGHDATTWDGCRVSAEEITEFAKTHKLLMLALTNRDTQYMWVTFQKSLVSASPPGDASIYTVTNGYSGEPVIPVSGRFGEASLWVTGLNDHADLLTLSAQVDGKEALCTYVSPVTNGRRVVAIVIPPGTRTGLVPVSLQWNGKPLGKSALARMIPPSPRIASVAYVADGLNRLLVDRIESGWAKLAMDEVENPDRLGLSVGGKPLKYNWFCVNPLHERYEFNFQLPAGIPSGQHAIELYVGDKRFPPLPIEVVRSV